MVNLYLVPGTWWRILVPCVVVVVVVVVVRLGVQLPSMSLSSRVATCG